MKAPNKFSYWRIFLAPMLFIAVFSVGCSKDDGGDGSRGGVADPCTNCAFTKRTLTTALGEIAHPQIALQVSLDFYGDAATSAVYGGSTQQMLNNYHGPLAAVGDLFVDYDDECGLASGRYELATLRAGQMSGHAIFANVQLQGTLVETTSGYPIGEKIVVSLPSGFLQSRPTSYDYYNYPYDVRIQGTGNAFRIESVNGVACNRSYPLY